MVDIVEGPDLYLFGEETALLEVIEGEDPLPRHLPPYHYGLFTTSPQLGWSAGTDDSPGGPTEESSNPALVNNVEEFNSLETEKVNHLERERERERVEGII